MTPTFHPADAARWRAVRIDNATLAARCARVTKRSIKNETKDDLLRLALSMIDLTTLEGQDTPGKVRALCRKAQVPFAEDPSLPHTAAVCVYPNFVPVARDALGDSAVRIASVATGFPSGLTPLATRLAETRQAVAWGAHEIDMVIDRGAFLSGQDERVFDEIVAVKDACGPTIRLKVILETGELGTLDQVAAASHLAMAAGADFIKTSTGKIQPAATLETTLVMLEAIRDHYLRTGRKVAMKPAGGIRTAKQALHWLVLLAETLGADWMSPEWFRFGASSLANDLIRQIARRADGHYQSPRRFSVD
jgi:deoxyribose-phosphate aldolase